ncbi:MAG: galactokinase [Candidatus Thorarchaeota archaeon]
MTLKIPEQMTAELESVVGSKDDVIVSRAPGRIEVLGNHTDYNGGIVLASTINRFVWIAGIESESVNLHSLNFSNSTSFNPADVVRSGSTDWEEYAKGVYWALKRRRQETRGVTGVVYGDVPIGSGLSSSAAFEVSLTNLAMHFGNAKMPPRAKAMIAFEAEMMFCGVSCGVMDQFTSQLGKPNSLLGIFCANLQTRDIPVSELYRFVVANSMISRSAGDALNERRVECVTALRTLQEAEWEISSLSEIKGNQLDELEEHIDERLANRVRHVVYENQRVIDGMNALKEGQIKTFGSLLNDSHTSSKTLYEVSHPRLDLLVSLASGMDGVIGSRMTGAGLGGSTITMVKGNNVDKFVSDITQEYEHETGDTPEVIVCEIPGGVVVDSVE